MTSPTRPRVRLLALAAAGAAVLALAGCGDDDGGGADDTATEPTSSETAEPSESSADEPSETTTAGEAPVRRVKHLVLHEPAEGAVVSGRFDASGKANAFEANVPWELRNVDGDVLLDGFATAEGAYDKMYPWHATVDVSSLDPGDYLFVVMTEDVSDGEGLKPREVSANITVE